MTTTVYPIRLFGGRNMGVTYDSVAGTITVMNQALALSSLSSALQGQFASAVATTTGPSAPSGALSAPPAFGGDNVAQAVGAIMDATPTWREAIRTAVNNYAASISAGDPEQFTRR
jgi:hypothetical protein